MNVFVTVFLCVGIFNLTTVGPNVHASSIQSTTTQPECHTPGCLKAAREIQSFIDPSVDPCDDFYSFACGKFLKETQIPSDKDQVTVFTHVEQSLQNQLKLLIEEPQTKDEIKPFTLLKNFYTVCMNTSAIEADGINTVKEIIKDLGGWPVVEGKAWKEHEFDWQWSVFKFRKHGLGTDNFISFNLFPDFKNSSRRMLNLDQVELELDRENWITGLSDEVVKAYFNYMVEVAVIFGAERKFAEYELEVMIRFRGELANITLPPEERRNETALYNPMTIRELQERYPSIKWVEFINNVMAFTDRGMTINDSVVINVPEYISQLEKLLQKTSRRVQANHAIFQAVRSLQSYLPERIRVLQDKFETVLYGTTTRMAKWRQCINTAKDMLGHAAGALYIRTYFSEEARRSAIEMVTNIRSKFVDILRMLTWMDESTKATAIDKAMAIHAHIGYAVELLDDKKLEEYYEPLNDFYTTNYIHFIGNITMFKTDKTVGLVWTPINKTDWVTRPSPIVINAFYDPSENGIQFPAAILQGIFFDSDRIHAMNYGSIGQIIGHELTHGFDDEGKQYDKNGNLVNWWDEGTDEAFSEKAKCIIDQYNNITVPEVKLNLHGINTQGENIADNGGLKEAYLAYQSWVEVHGPEPQLPGLNYTANQLFWISVANTWCTCHRKESLRQDVLTDNHSPPKYRVLVPLRNSDYFHKDFHCKEGSNMNPKEKCSVW
ncbi:hypothetical protein PPYR_08716 [Photinus pyralis]|uniref:Uncharacterized protein n=1 Tax=Photinus pyralis TaxID=7054 RepID=A0A1Y1JRI3_PHOPY|nr:neprilysin-2-like isoform X2 [Photinus pyralis]KAB0797723.1 hypothetical protein PPYR_08716 [Photinus pyralis]